MADYDDPRPSSQPTGSTDQAVLKDNLITLDRVATAPAGEVVTNRVGDELVSLNNIPELFDDSVAEVDAAKDQALIDIAADVTTVDTTKTAALTSISDDVTDVDGEKTQATTDIDGYVSDVSTAKDTAVSDIDTDVTIVNNAQTSAISEISDDVDYVEAAKQTALYDIEAAKESVEDEVGQIDASVAAAAESEANAAASESAAEASAAVAEASSNFVGKWSNQTGSATVPYSVYHDGNNWQLLEDVADVTLSEPSASNDDWAVIATVSLPEPDVSIPFNNGIGIERGYPDGGSVTLGRLSASTNLNKSGVIESLADDEPGITSGGLSIFEDYINISSYSDNIDTANASCAAETGGTGVEVVVTPNFATAPNLATEATRLQLDLGGGSTSTDQSGVTFSYSPTVGESTYFQVWMKSNDGNDYDLSMSFNGANPDTSSDNVSGQVATVSDEWQLFMVMYDVVDVSSRVVKLRLRGNQPTSDTADILIWGTDAISGSDFEKYPHIKTEDASESSAAVIASIQAMGNMPGPGKSFSVSADLSMTGGDVSNPMTIFNIRNSGVDGYIRARFISGGFLAFQCDLKDGAYRGAVSSESVAEGNRRVTFVYDNAFGMSVYIDGSLAASNSASPSDIMDIDYTGDIDIGGITSQWFLNSEMKNFKIWHSALTAAEVAQRGGAE